MKNIYYSLSSFHKAIKRNNPASVVVDPLTLTYYFFTRKACINYVAVDCKDAKYLELWLKNQLVELFSEV